MKRILETLLTEYQANPVDEKFPDRARLAIAAHVPRPREGKLVDPSRIRTTASSLSTLKWKCFALPIYAPTYADEIAALSAAHPTSPAWAEWDACKTPAEHLRLRSKWVAAGLHPEFADITIVPEFMHSIGLTPEEMVQSRAISAKQAAAKLGQAQTVNVDILMQLLMPGLAGDEIVGMILALLLATGRRTCEILQTAEFKRTGPYRVLFAGHAKSDTPPYEIDLLAGADECIAALARLRAACPCAGESRVQINAHWAGKLNAVLGRQTTVGNTHALRAINAIACHKLHGGRSAQIGYVKKQLGHRSAETSAVYSTWLTTVTKPWGAPDPAPAVEVKRAIPKLSYYSSASAAKCDQIKDMMREGVPISQKAIIKRYGGWPALVKAVLEMNAEVIAEYNSSLAN